MAIPWYILFVLVRLSRSLDYSDLEAVGVSCPERDSCARIDGDGGPETRNCECDSDCRSYGDCCVDAPYRRRRPSSGNRKQDVVCLSFGQDNHTGIYAVARCRSEWNGPRKIREKCEGSPRSSDPESGVPVTNVAQSVIYKNRFCAQCNDADDVKAFRMKLACGDGWTPTPHYDERRAAWGVYRSDRIFVPCEVTFELPDPLKASVRLCRANVVAECAKDWTDRATLLRCDRYAAVVHDAAGRAYRNPHCALCNHRKLDDVTCGGRRKRTVVGKKCPYAFTPWISLELQRLDHKLRCPPPYTYDPFFQKCRRPVA